MTGRRFTAADLVPLFACVVLALGAHVGSVPIWVLATAVAAGAMRVGLARLGRPAPALALRLLIAALAVALLYLKFRTFNGLTAGTALLALMTGMKLLETDSRRDLYVVTLLIYFLSLAALLVADSFWLLSYCIAVCWLTTATLLRLTTSHPLPGWRPSMLYSGRILLQALPLALAFWLFFPRFGGPLWQLPSDGQTAQSGLSDSMSPGDITELALSDEVAFRVRFANAAPPSAERYWRGPVMHNFDGHTWNRGRPVSSRVPPLVAQGPAYTYTVSLEPHQHTWVFVLDWPSRWDLPRGALTPDYTLAQPDPISRAIDVTATSHTHVESPQPLTAYARRRDIQLPIGRNPRTLVLAQTLRHQHPDDSDYVRAVLEMFARESFYYTLTPPPLSADSVDAFLFDTKRGFCGHYASAFAALMRAAGIPAHIVTGYQGGTFNRFANYWIVRQSEAHAWNEVWIDGRGWVRIDPTASIAPERIDPAVVQAANGAESLGGWRARARWMADLGLRLDALRQLWRERILLFDQSSQQELLEALHIPEPDAQKLVIVLSAALLVVLGWLTWSVRREVRLGRRDPLLRAYARLCRKLARAGLARRAHEGAEDYAARLAALRPDLALEVGALLRQYSRLRYESPSDPSLGVRDPGAAVRDFAAAVRAFRPRSSPTPQGSHGSSET